jgi:hypothetical protein
METDTMFDTRESYLQEAANLILDELIMPAVAAKGFEYPRPAFRISVGWPKHSRGGKAVAQCFTREASTDGRNEIFVTPEIDDPVRVMDAVAHELIHAVDDCASGHRNFFAAVARAIGLEGPLTATEAGPELAGKLSEIAGLLGGFPHHRMDIGKSHKPGGTRLVKVECSDCGFHFRTSQKQIDLIPADHACPACAAPSSLQTV